MWCEFWPRLLSADWLLLASALHSTSPKNQLRMRRRTFQGWLLSSRCTRCALMNKEWTSQSLLSYTHTQCLPMCVNLMEHTPAWFSHPSELLFFNRKKKGWVKDAAVCRVELLASMVLVGLSVHVQRQPLSATLSGGWWAWVLRAEGLWHCLRLCVCVFMCVCVCDACLECVLSWAVVFLGPPELLHTPLWQRRRGTISNRPLLLFSSRERLKQPSCERASD